MNPTLRAIQRNFGDFKVLVRQALAEGVKDFGLLDGTSIYDLFLQNAAGVLQVRNPNDDAYMDFAALGGTFNARLKAVVDLLLGGAALLKYDGGLKFRNASDNAYVNLEALAGTFNARLTAISDVLVGNKVLLKPYATGNLLLLRNPDDTANADLYGNAAYFADRVKADVIEPNTGSVITLGGAGHRVKLPNVTDQTGIADRETYRFESGGRREFRMATTVGATVVPKTLNMTTLLADYDGSVDAYRSVIAPGSLLVAQTFKPAYDCEIGAVILKIRKVLAPTDSCRLEIRDVGGGGKPTGAALAVSQAVDGAELTTTATNVAFRFSSPVSRAAGQATAFVLNRLTFNDTMYYQVAVDNTSPAYGDGQIAVGSVETWTLYAEDASFFEVWSPTTGGASGGGGGAATDEYVKVSSNDTTPNHLLAKLAAGTGITISELNDAGDEDAQITHAQVATGDLHTEYQKESEREAASGYAGLDASSKVIKDPANATATPTASKIPIAGAGGKLAAGWVQEVLAYADLTDDPYADHNARHEPGGADPMAVDAAAATGSLRTIGTGALTACAGNDARLSDARTPAAHGPSKHTEGTAWRLIYLNADGDETEIVLGANGTFLESNGAAAAPAFRAIVHGDVGTTSMKQAFLLTAGAGRATTTAGCSAPTLIEAGTNDVDYVVLDFDKDTDEYAFWGPVVTPYNWDGSTVTATLYWTAAAGSAGQTVVWSIQMASRANDEAIDAAWGTAVAVSDALIATGDVHRTPASGAITPAGTPAGGELLFVRVMRDVSEDTLAGDARLIGVWIEYGVSTLST